MSIDTMHPERIDHLASVVGEVERLVVDVLEPWIDHFDHAPDGALPAQLLRRNTAQLYTLTEALRHTLLHVRRHELPRTAS